MTRTDRNRRAALLAIASAPLLLAACHRSAGRQQAGQGTAPAASNPAQAAAVPASAAPPALPRTIDTEPVAARISQIVSRTDVVVNGQPACALRVRYAGALDQPVTWRGEPCSAISIRFVTLDDLRKIGQVSRIEVEASDDIAQLPGGKALYIEGRQSSALYPANVVQRIYKIPLAD